MSTTPANAADLAVRTIEGARDAYRLIAEIRQGRAHPDRLLVGIRMLFTLGDEVRLRGAMREFQKLVEFQG